MSQPIRVWIDEETIFCNPLKYTLLIAAKYFDHSVEFVPRDRAELVLTDSDGSHVSIAKDFYRSKETHWSSFFKSDCFIRDASGKPDYLTTAFYLLSYRQEYGVLTRDEFGRFPFKESYQYHFQNLRQNLVGQCFELFAREIPRLNHLKPAATTTRVFLTHDIDTVYGSLLQDSYYLLRNGQPQKLFKVIFDNVVREPQWLNMDKIMKIEDEHSFRSYFLWLVNKGKTKEKFLNADYSLNDPNIQRKIKLVKQQGWGNGLHKSLAKESFASEISKYGERPAVNRNHFLAVQLPTFFDEFETTNIPVDSSLGFAEDFGFRNSYALPASPFSFSENRPYQFLEVPLTIMDGTFQKYRKDSRENTLASIRDFFDQYQKNSVITILWHNTFFTDYKFNGYKDIYRTILTYLHECGIRSIGSEELEQKYKITW